MVQSSEGGSLSVLPAQTGAIMDALGLDDVTGIDTELLSVQDCVTLIAALESQLSRAQAIYESVRAPMADLIRQARARVKNVIVDAGGKALPHDTFDVRLEQRYERDKRIAVLIEGLEGHLPDDLFGEAIYVKQIAGTIAPEVLAIARQTPGCKVHYDADLRKLDKYARDFGGEIAKAVAAGAPRVAVGPPQLVIEPRKSALKVVGS